MPDSKVMARLHAVTVEDDVYTAVDPIIVLAPAGDDSDLRGGTVADVDLRRAAADIPSARARAQWRPGFTNRTVAKHFSGPTKPLDQPASIARTVSVRVPRLDDRQPVEVRLFWIAMQLLGEWESPDESAKLSAVREVRATCGAAFYARTKNVDADLIDQSLDDVAVLCDTFLYRRDAIAVDDATAPSRHTEAVRAVSMLATGLPSAARLRIEAML